MPHINFEVEQEQYKSLKEAKKRNGLTWKGMLLHAQRNLDGETSE